MQLICDLQRWPGRLSRDSGAVLRNLISWSVGALLLTAAVLKAWQAASLPLASAAGMMFLAAVEAVVGVALLFPLAAGVTGCFALALFSAFFGYALAGALGGRAECNCFGAIPVPTTAMLVVDAMVVTALLVVRPAWYGFVTAALVFALAYGVTAGTASSAAWADLAADGEILQLTPGAPFPREALLGGPADLATGQWTVVFHRTSCPECERVLSQIATRAARPSERDAPERLLLVEVGSAGAWAASPVAERTGYRTC